MTVLVPDAVEEALVDEARQEALFRHDLKEAGLVLAPRPASNRPPARVRRLIEVKGEPLSQLIIQERG